MSQDQKLDQLKQKYQSAIDFMKQSGVRLAHVHVEKDKLFIQGEAPSDQVKNKVWDRIKQIDSTYSDLTCDLTVNPSLAAGSAGAGATPAGGTQTYTVKSGDTLSKIAKQFYGEASQYNRIFEANRDQLSDPNKIQVGQTLKIPGATVGVS
jgi:hypothetical protein